MIVIFDILRKRLELYEDYEEVLRGVDHRDHVRRAYEDATCVPRES